VANYAAIILILAISACFYFAKYMHNAHLYSVA
jgi:hypothetical protein